MAGLYQLQTYPANADLTGLGSAELYQQWSPAYVATQRADLHCVLLQKEKPVARCSLWWNDVPAYEDASRVHKLGVVGHYAAASVEAGVELITQIEQLVRAQQCTLVVGPMDGNTWRRYRFITRRGDEPAFFLEPDNPDDYPLHFQQAGYYSLAEYSSALTEDLSQQDARIPGALKRLQQQGIQLRPLDMANFIDELKKIYDISVASFVNNFLYTPIDEAEFIAQYQQAQDFVQADLTLVAEQDGQALAFLFALPDLNQKLSGRTMDTVIIKTVAVRPGRKGAGLGSVLVAEVQRIAYELGYRRAIHALMHNSNKSLNISKHYARSIRDYTLFAKSL